VSRWLSDALVADSHPCCRPTWPVVAARALTAAGVVQSRERSVSVASARRSAGVEWLADQRAVSPRESESEGELSESQRASRARAGRTKF